MRIRHIKGAEETVAAHPLVVSEPEKFRGAWNEKVFGKQAPLMMEIGTGMGTFIREKAVAEKEVNFIGLEMNSTVLLKAIQRYEKKLAEERNEDSAEGASDEGSPAEKLPAENLRFIASDARKIEEYFAEGEISRIYLNFSDPWPKAKNANKRLTSPVFLNHYRRILAPGGVIEFKTDNRGLFDYSVETVQKEGGTILAITYDLHHDEEMNRGNIMTEYEFKFSSRGNLIQKMIFRLD